MRLRRLSRTVRFRVTFLATAGVLVVLAAAGLGIVVAQERLLTENLDESLEQGAINIETAVMPATSRRCSGASATTTSSPRWSTDRAR